MGCVGGEAAHTPHLPLFIEMIHFSIFEIIDVLWGVWYPSASKDTSKFTLERGRCWLTGTPVSLFVRLFRMNELVPETNFLFC